MKAQDLEVQKNYLINFRSSNFLIEITVWQKSKTALKFSKLEDITNITWKLYENFDSNYEILECLSVETKREPYWEIIDLLEVQKKSALTDSYNLGLYNGMELCLAIIQKREPKYLEIKKKEV